MDLHANLQSGLQEGAPGFYGKVTSHGDFVTRRLPQDFVSPWDDWLQHSLAASRDQLQREWLETWLTSPIWRFGLAPGVIGASGWAGVMMPSVDRVGRHFPLTIAGPVSGGCQIFEWVREGKSWYENLEDLALSSLSEGFQMAQLESALQATPGLAEMLALSRIGSQPPIDPAAAVCYSWQEYTQLEAFLPSLANEIAHLTLHGYSFWWTEGSQKVLPSLLVCRGLPSAEQYCALLDGRWREHGWQWR